MEGRGNGVTLMLYSGAIHRLRTPAGGLRVSGRFGSGAPQLCEYDLHASTPKMSRREVPEFYE